MKWSSNFTRQAGLSEFVFSSSLSACPPSASPSGEAGGDESDERQSTEGGINHVDPVILSKTF